MAVEILSYKNTGVVAVFHEATLLGQSRVQILILKFSGCLHISYPVELLHRGVIGNLLCSMTVLIILKPN